MFAPQLDGDNTAMIGAKSKRYTGAISAHFTHEGDSLSRHKNRAAAVAIGGKDECGAPVAKQENELKK